MSNKDDLSPFQKRAIDTIERFGDACEKALKAPATQQPDERTDRLRTLLSGIRIGCTERYQAYEYAKEGTPEYAAVSPFCIDATSHLRRLLAYAEEAEGIIRSSPVREISSPILSANWQPIETAPKDGTYVLVFWNGKNMDPCRWLGKHGWQPYGSACVGGINPTHWMPMPAPPADDQARRG